MVKKMKLYDFLVSHDGAIARNGKALVALANAIGKSPETVYHVAREYRRCTPDMAVAIEDATDGQVMAGELRPDLAGRF